MCCEFDMDESSSVIHLPKLDESVNEFLLTIEAENIHQISYHNSSAGMGERYNPRSIMIAAISYFVYTD